MTTRFRRRSQTTYPRNMGWLVVFCSFAALALGPGLLNAYGVYEEEYDRLYDGKDEGQGRSSALGSPVIFIGILQILLANGMGFIGGRCAQRIGPGPTVFVGGILMSLGLLLASYSRHIWQLCLTQGVLFGLGVTLTWIPAASSPSSWFDKSRGLATGITHMGLGIGGLIFAPLTRFLLEKAGTGGSLRWLALIMLVCVTVASLGIHSKRHDQRVSEIVVSSVRWSKCLEDEVQRMPESGYDSDQDMDYPEYRRTSLVAYAKATSLVEESINEADYDADCEKGADIDADSAQGENIVTDGAQGKDIVIEGGGGGADICEIDTHPSDGLGAPKHVHFAPDTTSAKQAALARLEGLTRTKPTQAATASKGVNGVHVNRPPSFPGQPTKGEPKSVFRSWRFWLLSLGIGLGQAAWYIVLLFMTSISVSVGLDVHNAALLLGAINGASAVGQFTAGYAADIIGPVNALVVFTGLATISNAILFVPRLTFHLLLVYACLCGASIGASDPLAVMAGVTQFGRARAASTTGYVYGSVGAFVMVTAPNAHVILQRLGFGTNFTPVYVFILALFGASTLLLGLLQLRISRRLCTRA
ncbi:hypothetical protein H4S07_000326 [Coemansia furcata]|uniref:Uncharacterized protein n=1 Tax=Coemansia furcata TaxID=417177 RepID=A0ACC1LSK5_9FUNG|nr:hypothetical protein H4S07_000326 [Coemansia furcata]